MAAAKSPCPHPPDAYSPFFVGNWLLVLTRQSSLLGNQRSLTPPHLHGDEGTRTPGFLLAKQALSRLSYVPSVGLSRLERLTSRLSGECSNPLSYRPVPAPSFQPSAFSLQADR